MTAGVSVESSAVTAHGRYSINGSCYESVTLAVFQTFEYRGGSWPACVGIYEAWLSQGFWRALVSREGLLESGWTCLKENES